MPTELKDGLGNEFTLRSKDVTGPQNNTLRQNWHLSTKFPIDHSNGGAYFSTLKSNTMAAGLVAASPIASFRFASTSLMCLVRRLEFSMWTFSTAFVVGLISVDAFMARLYSSEDTGGLLAALSGNVGKLRTSHQTTQSHLRVSDTAALSVGTRTLDAVPFENVVAGVTGAAMSNNVFFNNQTLFADFDHPIVLGNQEGIVLQASVPGTGTWAFNVTAVWDEIEPGNY